MFCHNNVEFIARVNERAHANIQWTPRYEPGEQNARGSGGLACISLLFQKVSVLPPSQAKYVVVTGNFAGVDERSALLSTGALGYRACGVTGPGSYANYSP